MKIKCPLCDSITEIASSDNLDTKYLQMHVDRDHDIFDIVNFYVTQYVKIHEKIEELEKENKEYERELNDGATLLTNNIEIEVLKSLLDNEK